MIYPSVEKLKLSESSVEQEISTSFDYITSQKDVSIKAIKVYLTIVFGLFVYSSFIETRIIEAKVDTPSDDFFVFGIFGVFITTLTFMIGWALLDFITRIIYGVIKQYKHISYMRYLKSQLFITNTFRNYSINPILVTKIPMRISRHLPVIFNLMNFFLLCFIYYFLNLFLEPEMSITYTLVILGIFAIYYPNSCEKYYEEIAIAQLIKPNLSERKAKCIIRERIERNRKNLSYTRILC